MYERVAVSILGLTVACGDSGNTDAWAWSSTMDGPPADADLDGGEEPDPPGESGGGTAQGGDPGDESPKFDLGEYGDLGDRANAADGIPSTCARAEEDESSVGC